MTKPLATLTIPMPESCADCNLHCREMGRCAGNGVDLPPPDKLHVMRHPDCPLKPVETVRIIEVDNGDPEHPHTSLQCTGCLARWDYLPTYNLRCCPSCGREIEWVPG